MSHKSFLAVTALLAFAFLSGLADTYAAQSTATPTQPAASTPATSAAPEAPPAGPAASAAEARRVSRRAPRLNSKSAEMYYGAIWGVDSLKVKYAESGEIIRFAYRVLDADKAQVLNDKKNEPSLIDPEANVSLVVPSLPKVGKLRQSSAAQPGKIYWMAFSNKGRYVKPGHRVNVVIGAFRADGLIVE